MKIPKSKTINRIFVSIILIGVVLILGVNYFGLLKNPEKMNAITAAILCSVSIIWAFIDLPKNNRINS